MKKLSIALLIVAILALALATVASAAGPTNCNSGHGVFGAFSDPSLHFQLGQPPYFGDLVLGSAPGGLTGENNSNYSALCNGN